MQNAGKIATCLWFDSDGEQAAQLYTSLIANSQITSTLRQNPDGPPLLVEFTLDGVPYQALNGGPHFQLSEAASIVVKTEDQSETDRLWQALTANGGSPSRCGWLKDPFGVSWQVVPRRFLELIADPDREAANRVTQAMMAMDKLDIDALETAFAGG